MNNAIVDILMKRDGMTLSVATTFLRDAQNQVRDGGDPEEILYEELGLEPDYVFDLIEDMYEVTK